MVLVAGQNEQGEALHPIPTHRLGVESCTPVAGKPLQFGGEETEDLSFQHPYLLLMPHQVILIDHTIVEPARKERLHIMFDGIGEGQQCGLTVGCPRHQIT